MEPTIQQKLKNLPDKPGAYMMKDERGDVIYVGKAASLRKRVRSYFQKGQAHPAKVLVMLSKVWDVDWLATDSEVEALMLECNLIKRFRPRYNVQLRDDKHYPYLCVTTSEPFPRVLVVRRVKQDGNRYFGPYADALSVRRTLRLIRRIFRIRSCNKKLSPRKRGQDRPCLNLHLGQCDSPCSGQIGAREYARLVRDTCLFLEGRQESVASRLEREMAAASDAMEYERAARLRDQCWSIRKLAERQKVISTRLTDQDVISIGPNGGAACIQVLFVRAGKLVGQDHFFLDGAADEPADARLEGFIKQYYRSAAYVPGEILVSHEPPDRRVIEDWLALKRGSKVRLVRPRRGDKRKLVEMASANAALAAEMESSRESEDEGRAEAALNALREVLNLPEVPARIEAYDISNIQGKEAVGSMAVFKNGVPAKSDYRRFKIRVADQPDDYGMMREVIKRRLARAAEGDPKFRELPDLILVDGGRGQLNAALEAVSSQRFSSLVARRSILKSEIRAAFGRHPAGGVDNPKSAICVVSLAKRLEEVYTPESSKPLLLPLDSPALRLLQHMRDEAHRFALAYHRKLRGRTAKKSVLDRIPGIGEQRRKALIRRFGSVAGVRRASLDGLISVPGMTRSAAEAVFETLHGE